MRYCCPSWQRIRSITAFIGAILYFIITTSHPALADSLAAQRERYQQINRAWDQQQMSTVNQLFPTLKNYPLFPYLLYRGLLAEIDQTTNSQVNNFLAQYPDFPLQDQLRSRYIQALAKKQDWHGITSFATSPPDNSIAAQCDYYYAQWQTGQHRAAFAQAKSLWLTGESLPNECDDLFSRWQQSGQLTDDLVLQRMVLAMQEDQGSLLKHLVNNYLSTSHAALGNALLQLQNNPTRLANFAQQNGPNAITQQATQIIFSRLARQNSDNAQSMLNNLISWQKLDAQQQQDLKEQLAWQYMDPDTPSWQQQWRDKTIMQSQASDLIERRVRLAIANNNVNDLAIWLARLPSEAQQKDEWRYWQGHVLMAQGHQQAATKILTDLMQGRGFYPMAAAQKIGRQYPIVIDRVSTFSAHNIENLPAIARLKEWRYWDNDLAARREWRNLLLHSATTQQAELAQYAFEHGWANLSIQATIIGKLWNHLQQRFPIAWQQTFIAQTTEKAISTSYAMAIARQESALDPQARSAVGARGLMQLMPATAKHIARLTSTNSYRMPTQLLDPTMNIRLGTSYLEHVYQQFDNNRILASAAYNAGPGRVNRWLVRSGNQLDPVAFIETIPFSETRGYVKNVLAYDLYYRYFLGKPTNNLFNSHEWQQRY